MVMGTAAVQSLHYHMISVSYSLDWAIDDAVGGQQVISLEVQADHYSLNAPDVPAPSLLSMQWNYF